MSGPNRRWEGRRFSETELLLAYQRILGGRSYVEIAAKLDCSLKFLYRQYGARKERARCGAWLGPGRRRWPVTIPCVARSSAR